ncbi:uncharacterized protein TEOVI_000723300 [Trypanosoma equiperdum]|uniref:Uncharacterized protein n=4 Tax=Trypanozoon TaxID=39700 RepID=Q389A2_TRYB2|nr:hypothetical protein, conserved [Trypanosoma brucei gambiense DAL972]XP_823446.1 hypothetical protein, conserved [Trypanosoma brucei brucei TREU927]RHW68942.1 hypothetical protein DPX39_100130500 [Trypanosoma brucei equiperdum]SCU65048.1 hypothetical protein, conserved [Trypanosoma equiperdum]EAN78618.1 hypothetical protein, conserved [Trypanosoma brucei brucei TREU927]CBH16396.1 hypothetical protein, conserved [Trypanosoma brucei gambiense DAL972]|eukprot:XP_011778660.1 hypothetical protein, conserved [Trypanosoma brucei gambiense DAL972]
MEVKIGKDVALLTAHKTYRDDGEDMVKAVATYVPFMNYVAACESSGLVPSAFLVRNVRHIARRVVGVIMDVECNTPTGKIVQPVEMSDFSPAILLPVVIVETVRYALLLQRRCVAVGCGLTTEAFCGAKDSGDNITWQNHELLTSAGFDLRDVRKLGFGEYSVGNEGLPPYTLHTIKKGMSSEEFEQLQKISAGTADASLFAVRLEDVMSSVNDAKAGLAASVLLLES